MNPVAGEDAALGGGRRMQLDLRIESTPSQTRQCTMLALAKQGVLGASQDQRVSPGQLRPRNWTYQRLCILGQRWVAMFSHRLRVQFDLPCRRVKAPRHTVHLLSELAVARRLSRPHPARLRPQFFE